MSVFTSDNEIDKQQTFATLLSIYLLGMMAVIAAILTAAMVLQYANGEIPCPLCLLQRVAMFGVCFGIILQFRYGFSYRNTGMSMIFSLFLLIVSVRQTLLDIYPRPGHEYIGTSVFGLHMPVWSILIAVALLIAFAFQLIVWGGSTQLQHKSLTHQSLLRVLATALSLYVIAIGVINFVSVGVQCGVDECHTFGYALLK
ncbi:disulfide bond formation protein B [Brucella pseudogrignonensis]|uniref:disulfide bond formation protein B n=1 Tax=Brucella pseudogrignonensis TaxID=419475 RepID=UPI00190BA89F|nr:disulfide bond formation protein B [Brucella pseudogrignonensis]MBK0021348.1 disulfide bond formation protein B [Ochrobactrum sp. S45]MBK0041914.1 disulfide bond formation protein B [Ochrobactrum sp. S46]UKK93154.1 disulfide bond formation protein B [Brucella pseudogrignonensis]